MTLCIAAVAQQRDSRLVTDDEARKLVMAAMPSSAKHLPKFGLEGGLDPHDPRFYVFMAYWAGADVYKRQARRVGVLEIVRNSLGDCRWGEWTRREADAA